MEWEDWVVTASGGGVSFGVMEMSSNCGDRGLTLNILKTTKLYTLSGYVDNSSVKLFK